MQETPDSVETGSLPRETRVHYLQTVHLFEFRRVLKLTLRPSIFLILPEQSAAEKCSSYLRRDIFMQQN